jgi:para-aminobenzoate synthetase component 1
VSQAPPRPGDPLLDLSDAPRSACLLHAGRHDPRWARRSLLAVPRGAWVYTRDGRSTWTGPDRPDIAFAHEPFRDLDALLLAEPSTTWVGYLAYDLGRHVEAMPIMAIDDRRWPLAVLHRCPSPTLYSTAATPALPPDLPSGDRLVFGPVRSTFTRDAYQQAVARVVDRLHAGDAFEVNLTTRLTADFRGRPRDFYHALLGRSPAWYAAHLPLPTLDDGLERTIASVSPELFLELTPDGGVVTRPIKGSRRPGQSAERHPHAGLEHSEKDRAELAMVVDMLRNDLGRVAAYGSVRVVSPRTIERHPNIEHGVATVAARLRDDASPGDLLRAAFPGGSITGAPKVQAMHMIERLEPVRRGPYCGAVGWLRGRAMTLSLAIRTACLTLDPTTRRGIVDFAVGSGIVADSLPRAEWRETLHKAKPFRDLARRHRGLGPTRAGGPLG